MSASHVQNILLINKHLIVCVPQRCPGASCKVCVQFPVSSCCPLLWSHRKPFSLHSGQDDLWLAMLLTSPQYSSSKEDLLKAQGFPELVRQSQTSVLSHHFKQLSSTAELVFKKSASHCQQRYFESKAFNFCAHNYGKREKILYRSSSMSSATILLQTNLVFPS